MNLNFENSQKEPQPTTSRSRKRKEVLKNEEPVSLPPEKKEFKLKVLSKIKNALTHERPLGFHLNFNRAGMDAFIDSANNQGDGGVERTGALAERLPSTPLVRT